MITSGAPTQRPPRADISLAIGESAIIPCPITDSSGAALSLAGRSVFAIVRQLGNSTPVINRQLSVVSDGNLKLIFDSADTLAMRGAYSLEFWLHDPAPYDAPVSDLSTFTVGPEQVPTGSSTAPAGGGGLNQSKKFVVTFAGVDAVTYAFVGFAFANTSYTVDSIAVTLDPSCLLSGVAVNVTAQTASGITLQAGGVITGTVVVTLSGVLA